MKRLLVSLSLAVGLALIIATGTLAANPHTPERTLPQALCLPGVYLNTEMECSVLGPAAQMTEVAYIREQITTQAERFPYIPESYGESEYNYFRVYEETGVIFSTFETAVANTSPSDTLFEGYTSAAYTRLVEQDGRKYFQLDDGRWMRGSSVAAYATPNRFLGVQPTDHPTRKFGWILKNNTPTVKAPGYYEPLTGNQLSRYTLVEVFEERRVGLSDWYMIAPDEWLYMTQVALVHPAEAPPEGVTNGRWIEINIFEQTLAVYENNQLLFATLITSGSSRNYTRPGLFQIYEKLESTDMAGDIGQDGAYSLMDVPWTMYFDERRALHAEYWHDHLGYKSSHGCVNLSFPDADWLYQWADYGDWVYAWDPSGQTPEELGLFTDLLEN